MKPFFVLSVFGFCVLTQAGAGTVEVPDYGVYHERIIEAQKLIAGEEYAEALRVYEKIFDTYHFVFLRDYQVATQLALRVQDKKKAVNYLKKGILRGWEVRSIKKNEFLGEMLELPESKAVLKDYKSLRRQYEAGLDQDVRDEVKEMFSRDQWKALGALFTFSSKAQDRYAERKFAPHSEKQMSRLIRIIREHGYPGEQSIGNNYWVMTILSHHNSISREYVRRDTLYQFLKPILLRAVSRGQMSPFEFAFIDDWYRAVKDDRRHPGYGFLRPPSRSDLPESNSLRQSVGLGSIEVRNRLAELEHATGMNFSLPGIPWVTGKIQVEE